jgi:hypothetical protein
MTGRFVTLPKAEVHVHLEGCFEVDDIVRLARENGVQLPRQRERLLEFGGLAEFLEFRASNSPRWRGDSANDWRRTAHAMPTSSSIRRTGTIGRGEFRS